MTWELFTKGVVLGMSLSILVGPLLIAIVQTSIEQGRKAGLMVGAGIWLSDILFIATVYFGISSIQKITEWEGFEMSMGVVGGMVLALFGLGTIFAKAPDADAWEQCKLEQAATWKLLLKGFLINTLNPFTFFFWISVTSTIVVDGALSSFSASLFYGGLLGTIIATDSLKAIFADKLRTKLTPKNMLLMRQIAGVMLIIFGIVLIIRVL